MRSLKCPRSPRQPGLHRKNLSQKKKERKERKEGKKENKNKRGRKKLEDGDYKTGWHEGECRSSGCLPGVEHAGCSDMRPRESPYLQNRAGDMPTSQDELSAELTYREHPLNASHGNCSEASRCWIAQVTALQCGETRPGACLSQDQVSPSVRLGEFSRITGCGAGGVCDPGSRYVDLGYR